jgi:hypothetical protein
LASFIKILAIKLSKICLKEKKKREKRKKKKRKKLCIDPGSNQGSMVEPSVGSLTRCHTAMKAFKKIQKNIALYFMGKNMSRVPYGTPH